MFSNSTKLIPVEGTRHICMIVYGQHRQFLLNEKPCFESTRKFKKNNKQNVCAHSSFHLVPVASHIYSNLLQYVYYYYNSFLILHFFHKYITHHTILRTVSYYIFFILNAPKRFFPSLSLSPSLSSVTRHLYCKIDVKRMLRKKQKKQDEKNGDTRNELLYMKTQNIRETINAECY